MRPPSASSQAFLADLAEDLADGAWHRVRDLGATVARSPQLGRLIAQGQVEETARRPVGGGHIQWWIRRPAR